MVHGRGGMEAQTADLHKEILVASVVHYLHDSFNPCQPMVLPAYNKAPSETLTRARLFESKLIRLVTSRMLVKQTKMNMSGGPKMGEICTHELRKCVSGSAVVPAPQYPIKVSRFI